MIQDLNPPRVVATWAVEQYWAEEYTLAYALRDKIVADVKRALDSIPDRVPYPTDVEIRPFGGDAGVVHRAAVAAAFWQRYVDRRCSRLSPHVLR